MANPSSIEKPVAGGLGVPEESRVMNVDPLLRLLSMAPVALYLPLYCAGIFLSVINWRRAGRSAKLVLAGCVVNLLAMLVLQPVMAIILARTSSATEMHLRVVTGNAIHAFIGVIGWGMILSAAFIGRPRNPEAPH